MAIAFDAASGGNSSGASSLTFSHTCTGSNLILWVAVFEWAVSSVTGVTYNGVAMTMTDSQKVPSANNPTVSLWYLANPATGAHNVVVSRSSSTFQLDASSASYTGANAGGIPDAHTTNSAAGGTGITTSVTTVNDNCWYVMGAINDANAISAGTGTTNRNTQRTVEGIFDGNTAKTPAGSASLAFTHSSGGNDAVCMASFSPIANLSITDTQASTDTVSIPLQFTATDTQANTDTARTKFGFSNQTKNTSTWTNQTKN